MLTQQFTTQEIEKLDWEKVENLMPVVVQHAVSGSVLMM
ncbi:bifunctional phosphoribosyl-AMP cyclohydrolase/phosphoribosyl-ATP diphosphatase, partial [Xenorhabdus bovienii]|nr:bifunctional phosphoribosyl-AMP cyclohydrolase/phosphoribosyl-ATP diphosphatase [Xenorhabdus bovienii]